MGGIMAHLEERNSGQASVPPSGISTPITEYPQQLPARFLACVRRESSAKRIKREVGHYQVPLTVFVNENAKAVAQGDVIILGCKPQMFREILQAPGIKDALRGKLLISILAGVTAEMLEEALYANEMPSDACRVVRAMPNTAALVRESMTVIATTTPPLPQQWSDLVTWIFSRVGRVVHLPPSSMDACTAMAGSGPAFMALVLEAFADGGVAMGIPRAEAQAMAAQVMKGTAGLVASGEHPAVLRDKVSTPGGCTIGGLLVLEEGRTRGTVARAVREATVVASQLGKGVIGVNGTRFGGGSF